MELFHTIRGIAGILFIGLGLFFSFAMTVGMIRFPDPYSRLHAGTKGLTIGAGFILLGSAVMGPSVSHAVKTMLIGVFLMITNPISIHSLARANYRSHRARRRMVVDEYWDKVKTKERKENDD